MNEEQARKLRKLVTDAIIASEMEAVARATGLVRSGFYGKSQSLSDAKTAINEYIDSLTEPKKGKQ